MQFGFMPGHGTTDAIFTVRQIQEAYIRKNQICTLLLVTYKKPLTEYLGKFCGGLYRKLVYLEWIVHVMQVMYQNARSQVRVNNLFSGVFDVKVGVHQASVLSPLLFIIALEALSLEFQTICPWKLLYADNPVLLADTNYFQNLEIGKNIWMQKV